MKILGTFRRSETADYSAYKERVAGRAVLFEGPKVALLFVGKSGYYTLPGGGLDGDDIERGLQREIREETGYDVTLGSAVGSAVTYLDRWQNKQVDHCYTARVVGSATTTNHTDFELSEGYRLVWAPSLLVAITLAEAATTNDPEGQLIRARDLLFLKTVASNKTAASL